MIFFFFPGLIMIRFFRILIVDLLFDLTVRGIDTVTIEWTTHAFPSVKWLEQQRL